MGGGVKAVWTFLKNINFWVDGRPKGALYFNIYYASNPSILSDPWLFFIHFSFSLISSAFHYSFTQTFDTISQQVFFVLEFSFSHSRQSNKKGIMRHLALLREENIFDECLGMPGKLWWKASKWKENPIKSRPISSKVAFKRRADAHIGDFNPFNESAKLVKAPGPYLMALPHSHFLNK